jgi:HSP20 family protein
MDTRKELSERRTIVPACSIVEDEGIVTVRIEMPGVSKEGLEVKVEGNELAVFGGRRTANPAGTYLVRERRAESFRKTFTLDETIARDKIDASLVDGILTIKLHVTEAAKPRRIEIT